MHMATLITAPSTDLPLSNSQPASSAPSLWLTPKNWFLSLALVSVAFGALCISVAKSYVSHSQVGFHEAERVENCRTRIAALYRPQAIDLNLAGNIHGLCYAEVNEEDRLVELAIRRSAFLDQQAETSIMLWMVVAITVSGVVLAGLQLMAGYKLASAKGTSFEQGGELSLENNKLSLKSSVTGLIILTISLAFFYVFVSQVYLIKEFDPSPPPSVGGVPDTRSIWGKPPNSANTPGATDPAKQQLTLQPGGLGPAPGGNAQPFAGPTPTKH
jgi:hypothetical protein